jgi:predicted nucleotidyltransferase
MGRKQIKKIIKIYLAELARMIKIDKAILFGSALKGKLGQDKDIDLLILSPSFSKMEDSKRFDLLYTARKKPVTQSVPMDIFGLTPEEYSRAHPLSIVGEIKETGKEVL